MKGVLNYNLREYHVRPRLINWAEGSNNTNDFMINLTDCDSLARWLHIYKWVEDIRINLAIDLFARPSC